MGIKYFAQADPDKYLKKRYPEAVCVTFRRNHPWRAVLWTVQKKNTIQMSDVAIA